MELLEYFNIIKKRLWIIIAITVIAASSSAAFSIFVMDPVYEAKSTLIIGRAPDSQVGEVQYNDILMYQKLVKTYAEMAKSNVVAQETISNLKYNMSWKEFQDNLAVTPKGDTQLLEIAVEDKDPVRAAALTNMLSKVFIEKTGGMMKAENIQILDEAQVPQEPVKPRTALNTAIAGFLGIIASLGLVFLIEYLDSTMKTEEDISRYLGIPVLASIPYTNEMRD